MPLNAIRRLLPRKVVRDEYSFELLRSSSAHEMMPSSSTQPHADLPRYYSNYDHVTIQSPRLQASSSTASAPATSKVRSLDEFSVRDHF
ncbi:hypothetical protein Y032_0036g3307 [Ancylostoma ceylanicum]|uniref:Uncharacterized protein n=1 Tax=Ancylostoma ceylanicum TaxID=53326 RepID=A0A016ULC9_9BILA|nr:hypothetical protein Y032_0036g3307 [Ancylostoma ceylanicum]